MATISTTERVAPIQITDTDTNTTYVLDFNRESVLYADRREFRIQAVGEYIASGVSDLFYYSFRANHRSVSRQQAYALLDKMGGVTNAMLERLIALYMQVINTHIIADEDAEKNSAVIVEM